MLETEKPATITIEYKINGKFREAVFGIGLYTIDGKYIIGINTQLDDMKIDKLENKGKVEFKTDYLPLLAGEYILQVAVVEGDGTPFDYFRDYSHFGVVSSVRSSGLIHIPHKWILK
jgi:hypothetical protein